MKILLVSDSHNDYQSLERLYKMYPKMDLYLHAGDSEQDEYSLTPFISVKGNCDRYDNFLDHFLIPTPFGNMYVQHFPHITKEEINKTKTKIFVHGHTHVRRYENIDDLIYINPGALTYARDQFNKSYAILTIEKDGIDIVFNCLK